MDDTQIVFQFTKTLTMHLATGEVRATEMRLEQALLSKR
jgi:hypothetical protein